MNYWVPSQWLDSFDDMLDSELNYGDQWSLNFNYKYRQTDDISYEEQRRGWMVCEHWGNGRFCCSCCSWEWTSMNVIRFRYRWQSASERGTVIMTPYGQVCRRCGTLVLPGYVENALQHLSVDIKKNCYAVPVMKTFDWVVASPGYAWAQDRHGYVLTNLAVTNQEKWRIERQTVGQSNNLLWFDNRKNRITASYFGEVLAAVWRSRRYPPSLFKKLLGKYNLSRSKAVLHGIRNEPIAKQQYTQLTGRHIQERGVFLSESGLLGASPDGTVSGGDRIIEVKCPWSARRKTVWQAAREMRNFYLQLDEVTGALTLNKHHITGFNYWHQIQGNLHLSGANSCDLVIWTHLDLQILSVPKDPTWAVNIHTLETFYKNAFLPHVLSQM